MYFTQTLAKLLRNKNAKYWNRRVWEIGYRGTPISSLPTKRPPIPITPNAVLYLQEQLRREYVVMQWLATPYLNENQERQYVEKNGSVIDAWKKEQTLKKCAKMPNKPKLYKKDGTLEKRFANVGNNLHAHITVEDSLKDLIRRNCWD